MQAIPETNFPILQSQTKKSIVVFCVFFVNRLEIRVY